MSSEDSWWRKAQRQGVDVAQAIKRAAGFMAQGGTDAQAAQRSRELGEAAEHAEDVRRNMLERQARAASEPTPDEAPLEIWVVCEELWEGRWRATSVEDVAGAKVTAFGSSSQRCRGADFKYKLAHHLQRERPHESWDQARARALRARIYVAGIVKAK